MALVPYSQQNDFDLVHGEQDIRGWTVYDEAGVAVGEVDDMIVDTDTEYVTALIITGGRQIPANLITIGDERVTVRGGAAQFDATPDSTAAARRTVDDNGVVDGQSFAQSPDSTVTARQTADLPSSAGADAVTLPVVEEQLHVGKREVEGGGVRVRQRIVETPVEETVRLREEHVHVERRAVDRPLTEADTRLQEDVIELTERAEEAVVSKQARVVEEVVVGKQVTEREETVRDTVRRTDVDVQEVGTDATRPAKQR